MLANAFVVMYRESFEAILIVGIIYSYLVNQIHSSKGVRYMWIGVLGGVVLSILLAWALNVAQTEIEGTALEHFNNGMIALAIIMMTHMCIWMKKYARTIRGELQREVSASLTKSQHWGIALLTCVAVGREGSETVIFLYSVAVESIANQKVMDFVLTVSLGLVASFVTWWAFNRGLKFFKQQTFFRVTTIALLVTASSLTLTLTRKLIQSDTLPSFTDPLWDTSFLLDEGGQVGSVFSALTGYQSAPALMTVLVYIAYWIVTGVFYFRQPVVK